MTGLYDARSSLSRLPVSPSPSKTQSLQSASFMYQGHPDTLKYAGTHAPHLPEICRTFVRTYYCLGPAHDNTPQTNFSPHSHKETHTQRPSHKLHLHMQIPCRPSTPKSMCNRRCIAAQVAAVNDHKP